MNERTKSGLKILQVALVLGVAGDILLRVTPWGLNVLLFNLAFAGGTLLLLWRHAPERLTRQTYALLGVLVFFASMFVWRDSIELRVADTFAIIVTLGVLFLPTLKVTARIGGAFHYAVSVVWAGINALFAPFALLASDIGWNDLPMTGWRKHAFAVFRSLLIATPLMLIFGALFMAADTVYDGWVRKMLDVDFETLFSHGALFAVFAWLTAGYFRGVVFGGAAAAAETSLSIIVPLAAESGASPVERMRAETGEHPVVLPDNKTVVEHINSEADVRPAESLPSAGNDQPKKAWSWADLDNSIVPGFTIGSVEVGVILGLVNLLFLSFVIFQVPYLFGGMDLVQNTPDFKLAEYARRGFGELVAVSALVLPMLLVAHWLIRKDDRFAGKLFKVFAGIHIALLFVIMASAVQRLVLLTGNLGYGLTTVRLYPMIFMTWLAVVFVWFALTVLRGARQHFAWGALWAAFTILGATHVLNPDAFIVRTNVALMQQGREFDAYYNSRLSDDAVPVIVDVLPSLNEINRCQAQWALHTRLLHSGSEFDLRSWNLSRSVARSTLLKNHSALDDHLGCPAWMPFPETEIPDSP
ncbi:MAG: DUF4173 domain-containing protein [Pyrinomonadaceae bacterium]|nr:DUF4173 domain-containing protein [Pyrinomonadaceae bacterium]MBP6214153.1 DUF4173 domain-containing protein [Pyrinomonadaceae bacterium]